jgi:ankyrin repeat protein
LNRTDATPLLLAAETGDLALIELLVEFGGDLQLVNCDNVTPLLAATGIGVLSDGDESAGTEEDAIRTSEYLVESGADINAVDDAGKTVMHGAAFKSWPTLIERLDQWGASSKIWNQKNEDGWTPLMIAQGQRPGNFRPSEVTIAALQKILQRDFTGSGP